MHRVSSTHYTGLIILSYEKSWALPARSGIFHIFTCSSAMKAHAFPQWSNFTAELRHRFAPSAPFHVIIAVH